MTPERWQQIDELFHAALAHEPAKRTAFLVSACGNDEELRLEVESLISFRDGCEDFIETPADDLAAAVLRSHNSRLEPGYQIDTYRLLRHLGTGGMGDVYLANDTRLHREIALKLLPPQFIIDPDRARRFDQEARAASALNHPNIVTVHDIGWSNSMHFITTEFVDGETLREHISRQPISIDEVLNISDQICSALQAAHNAGIVHRDIKPENIMLRRDGIVKVLDFGLAKLAAEQEEVHSRAPTKSMVHTNPGVVMGTVGYMSPEQARAADVDERTDIWSLGVVMYEMISGRAPFVGETASTLIVSIIEHEPAPLSINLGVPDELQRIVSKCLVKNREQRYQTVGDILADLKRLKQRLELYATIGAITEPRKTSHDAAVTGSHKPLPTHDIAVTRTGSRLVHFVRGLKSNRRRQLLAGGLAFVALITPVAYWRFKLRSANDTAVTQTNIGSPVRSVLVLPFENQTQNPDSDYLSDAIPITLSTQLSGSGSKVTTLGGSKHTGEAVDMQEAANTLGVSAILTGRIAKSGDNIVLSVELIDARDKSQIWREQYTRKLTHVLLVQLSIAKEIAQRLREMAFREFVFLFRRWPTARELN